MKKNILNIPALAASAVFLLLLASVAVAQIPEGARCAECGMKIDPNTPYVSYVVTNDGKTLYFDSIGDMLIHFLKKKGDLKEVHVKDYSTGQWIDGKKAFYVKNLKEFSGPMDWGIAAFK